MPEGEIIYTHAKIVSTPPDKAGLELTMLQIDIPELNAPQQIPLKGVPNLPRNISTDEINRANDQSEKASLAAENDRYLRISKLLRKVGHEVEIGIELIRSESLVARKIKAVTNQTQLGTEYTIGTLHIGDTELPKKKRGKQPLVGTVVDESGNIYEIPANTSIKGNVNEGDQLTFVPDSISLTTAKTVQLIIADSIQ